MFSGCPSVHLSVRCPSTPIWRDAIDISLVRRKDFNETCHKYSLCELEWTKKFSRWKVLFHFVWCPTLPTRNSSGDEIANVNFLYDDIVQVIQNTIDSCINSATDRRGYVLERMFTKFSEITQYNGHYVVQGHSRSAILVPIESTIVGLPMFWNKFGKPIKIVMGTFMQNHKCNEVENAFFLIFKVSRLVRVHTEQHGTWYT